ncbi:hypothetical protein M0R45_015335 [Rubus argutus]|uniref:Uncharacterized protein n=1 Tax=Rubus argutus TaxID=59490 RepID=A0AAW1XP73_RUBAR
MIKASQFRLPMALFITHSHQSNQNSFSATTRNLLQPPKVQTTRYHHPSINHQSIPHHYIPTCDHLSNPHLISTIIISSQPYHSAITIATARIAVFPSQEPKPDREKKKKDVAPPSTTTDRAAVNPTPSRQPRRYPRPNPPATHRSQTGFLDAIESILCPVDAASA